MATIMCPWLACKYNSTLPAHMGGTSLESRGECLWAGEVVFSDPYEYLEDYLERHEGDVNKLICENYTRRD